MISFSGSDRKISRLVIGLLVFCLPFVQARAADLDLGFSELDKKQKLLLVNAGTLAFITAWGIAKWDYGQRSPHMQSEGWFDNDVKEGGADKLGHLWSTYAFSEGLSNLYEGWGYNQEQAATYGALSSFAIMGFMEVGDSFSNYGFSYEDMLMNTAGSVAGYLMYKYPEFARKVDLRWEYAPAFDRTDLFTDYEHTKYLLALQLSGFDRLKDTPLQYLELQLGYYSRGFETRRPDRERDIYVGVGVNLARVFEKAGCERFCKVFHYYQPPHTYLSLDNDLND
jgi:Predicted periplasmic lipoprotein (DUF2279)